MLTLRDKLYESLLDDEEELINNDNALIEQFLTDNYDIKGTYKVNNGVVDVNGSIFVKNNKLKHLTDRLFKFGKISDVFSCYSCGVENLDGSPREVGGIFICAHCENLISLEGAPEHVGGNFYCDYSNIKDLKGSPKEVNGSFTCSHCENLISLEGAPRYVNGDFRCDYSNIKDLKGSPKEVNGSFICNRCENLISLRGLPKIIHGNFECEFCPKLSNIKMAYKVTKGHVY